MKNIRFRVVSLFLVLFSALPLNINNLDSFELHKFKSAAKVESNVVAWSYKDVLHWLHMNMVELTWHALTVFITVKKEMIQEFCHI